MTDPFSDFANLTLGPGGAYQQQMTYAQQPPMGGFTAPQPGAVPAPAAAPPAQPTATPEPVPQAAAPVAQQPVAPITATEDVWGIAFQQPAPAAPQPPAAAPPIVPEPVAAPAPAPAPAAAPAATEAVVPAANQTTPGAQAGVAVAAPPASALPPPPPASGLPEGWTAYTDQASGREYYAHVSGQVTWDKPAPQIAAAAAPATPQAAPQAAADPFAVFGSAEPAPAATADPFASAPQPEGVQDLGLMQSPSAHSVDSDAGAAAAEGADTLAALPGGEDDFWSQMGFGVQIEEGSSHGEEAAAGAETAEAKAKADAEAEAKKNRRKSTIRASVINIPDQGMAHLADDDTGADRIKAGGLPAGKEYEAHLDKFAFRLGAVFLTAKQCKSNLYCKVSEEVIKALGSRPVVAYIASDASAHKAGIHPGEILLKVNGKPATDPKQAQELVTSQHPPLVLTMLKPDLPIILGENQHMVKYNNSKPRAPTMMKEWKAKYVVVGGLAAKPYAMLMYYSKKDYDRAIASNLAHRHPDVKIKAFDLRGCSLIEDQTVHYSQNARSWHFFIIVPPAGAELPGGFPANMIKISHPVKEGLTPVLEAVRRVIKKYPTRPMPQYQQHRPQSGVRYY